jgi:alpha-tubulin suppressor-like RCC1 family protein
VGTSGRVHCWGSNRSLQAGQAGAAPPGDVLARPTPIADLAGALEVTAGDSHTCARRIDGRVWCWGNNDLGQLGVSDRTARHTPGQADVVTDATQVVAGAGHTCARL